MIRLPSSLTARLIILLAAGLLVLQMGVFALSVNFRFEQQFLMAASDRARLAITLYQLLAPLSPQERSRVVADTVFESFRLDLAPIQPVEQGTDAQSLFLLQRLRELYDFSHPPAPDGHAASTPLFARVDNFSINWQMSPKTVRQSMRHYPRVGRFEAQAALPFAGGAWLHVTYYTMPALTGSLFDLVLELSVQFLLQILLAVAITRYLMRPLRQLADFADCLTPEVPEFAPEGLPEQGPSEVMRTSWAFRAMYVRIRHFVQERMRLLASISHDLRTPIARLRLQLENEPALQRPELVFDALDDLQHLAEDAIALARTGANSEPERKTDLVALLESMVADYEEYEGQIDCLAGDPPCRVRLRVSTQAHCLLRPAAFRRCLENLVDNALEYGHYADVYLDALSPETARIRVEDQGPGIPAREMDNIFLPFYRLESSRNTRTGGTGLGLSIARDLARLNHTDIVLTNLPGGGLCASMLIPMEPRPHA